ncbi:unnamed protein product [Adineta steineri]|uniref:Uncharacterized protein n=1 Tax=Adineta steineri TaxID=433720 RepID=A0A814JK26_9BILA|nr:unnamed protein product [Adineta steineri]CAF1038806.1 unnamed protein product [Adineta steineri]CAF3483786.1 unnamed protein product [Adineta steineri]CAF3978802.1 unnamed protein product [Adineta steineri]
MAIIIATFITPSSAGWLCDCNSCYNAGCYNGGPSCGMTDACCKTDCLKSVYDTITQLKTSLATANQNYQTANQIIKLQIRIIKLQMNYQSALGTIDTVTKARDTCCTRATTLAGGRDNAISALSAIADVRRRLSHNDDRRRFFEDDDDDRRK